MTLLLRACDIWSSRAEYPHSNIQMDSANWFLKIIWIKYVGVACSVYLGPLVQNVRTLTTPFQISGIATFAKCELSNFAVMGGFG